MALSADVNFGRIDVKCDVPRGKKMPMLLLDLGRGTETEQNPFTAVPKRGFQLVQKRQKRGGRCVAHRIPYRGCSHHPSIPLQDVFSLMGTTTDSITLFQAVTPLTLPRKNRGGGLDVVLEGSLAITANRSSRRISL